MLGSNSAARLTKILFGIVVLVLLSDRIIAQVVIVSGRRLLPTASSKPRGKAKKRPIGHTDKAEQNKEQVAEIHTINDSAALLSQLSFTLALPTIKKAATDERQANIRE